MTISPLKLEMQQMAMEAKSIHPPAMSQDVVSNFGTLLSNALGQVNALQKNSSELATRFDQGDRSVSLADVMIARNKSSVAFDATIQTRNKLVEAYKELMNMPV